MRLIAFPQWDKLTSLLRGMARQSAADYAQRNIVRIIPKNGIAHLANYAVNLLAVEGGKTTIIMPDMTPGKAREFMPRVTETMGPHSEIRMLISKIISGGQTGAGATGKTPVVPVGLKGKRR